jgi:uncharacterized protein YprB with RNaseH-like and TPR domain
MGARDWWSYLENHENLALPEGRKALILPRVEESIVRLKEKDHRFFARCLPSKDHWRALSEFGDEIAYLDIETSGCSYADYITVIGLYDGREMQAFVRGINLDEFPEAVSRFKVYVTFFGTGFDIPFIRRTFPNVPMDALHVDLCFLLKRVGLSGGLKKIEHELGISRCPEADGMDGMDAVRLWYEWKRGNREALERLLLYNKEDVVNMQELLRFGCAEMMKSLPGMENAGQKLLF